MFLALTGAAHGATVYVANNGVDGPTCGSKTSPCRSISQAANTIGVDGDSVIVGPGRYGDLDLSGVLGDSAGEETGGFGCVLLIAHAVTITSSAGAAATVIDGRSVSGNCNVGIIVAGTHFGKPGKGFTVSSTAAASGASGILLNASNVVVQGNQIVAGTANQRAGILTTEASEAVFIEANQIIGWGNGIEVSGTGKTLHGNRLLLNETGIYAVGTNSFVGNVMAANRRGVLSYGSDTIAGNAAYGNIDGVTLAATVTGASVEKNDFVGNHCGIFNAGLLGVDAIKNYWGAASGPGPRPADLMCNDTGGTSTVTPFATKPYKVKALFKP
jgi:hypothetical protein